MNAHTATNPLESPVSGNVGGTVGAGGTARTGATSGTFDAVTVNGTGVFELSRASGTFKYWLAPVTWKSIE